MYGCVHKLLIIVTAIHATRKQFYEQSSNLLILIHKTAMFVPFYLFLTPSRLLSFYPFSIASHIIHPRYIFNRHYYFSSFSTTFNVIILPELISQFSTIFLHVFFPIDQSDNNYLRSKSFLFTDLC